jgi:hypothetical protein
MSEYDRSNDYFISIIFLALPRDTFLLNALACKERVGLIDIDESVSFCFNQVTL